MVSAAASPLSGSPPTPRTRLIGREPERATARAFLLDDAVPLLTLTGPGGVGKTRLALAVADDVAHSFADGVVWVDLAPLVDPVLIPETIATALELPAPVGVTLAEALSIYFRPRQVLLLLDNCEHVLPATATFAGSLLAHAPALQILATSRAMLHLRGEQILPVDPLPLPDHAVTTFATLAQNESVRLFVERARAVRPAFSLTTTNASAVAAICRQLEGLPLALELAAARITMLSPDALLAQLTHRLELLRGGARDLSVRQQTMATAIAWSVDLLDDEAQVLFRRLAPFVGGFPVEAAQAMAALPGAAPFDGMAALTAVVEQSLVRRNDQDDTERFAMLETIREHAWNLLEARNETAAARTAHAAWFLALAEEGMPNLARNGDPVWLDRLEREHDNLLAALGWLAETGDVAGVVRLAGALGWFWYMHGHRQEGWDWLQRALAMDEADPGNSAPPSARADARAGLGLLAYTMGEGDRAVALLGDAANLRRDLGDDWGSAYAESLRGGALISLGRYDEAQIVFTTLLPWWQAYGDQMLIGHALFHLGLVAYTQGDRERTARLCTEAVASLDAAASTIDAIDPLHYLGLNACASGDLTAAAEAFSEALVRLRIRQSRVDFANGFADVATLAVARAEPVRAARLFGIADTLRREGGGPFPLPARIAYDQAAATARSSLSGAAWGAAFAAGTMLALEDALAEAELLLTACCDLPATPKPLSPIPIRDEHAPFPGIVERLTRREREVLDLLCQRYTDPEIAELLFLSPRTASKHVSNILGKLGASSRREAAAIAARRALI